jgi:hypothetical protein
VAALFPPDGVQDVVFGVSLAVAGVEIIGTALKKKVASALAFFVAAASTYGVFYL